MPLFINFLPNSEPKGFDPSSNPAFAKFEPNPLPDCAAAALAAFLSCFLPCLIFSSADLAKLK